LEGGPAKGRGAATSFSAYLTLCRYLQKSPSIHLPA
jgi:hypothetical protein